MKSRINVHISALNAAKLYALNNRSSKTLTGIVDAALTDYFADNAKDERDAAIVRRLDRISRQIDRLERQNLVLGETLALFIRYFLMVTPQLPSNQLDAARAKGDQQFDQFLEQLGRDLQSGKRVIQAAVDDVIATGEDFFTDEELDSLDTPAPQGKSKPKKDEAGHA